MCQSSEETVAVPIHVLDLVVRLNLRAPLIIEDLVTKLLFLSCYLRFLSLGRHKLISLLFLFELFSFLVDLSNFIH